MQPLARLPDPEVCARVTPAHKGRLVTAALINGWALWVAARDAVANLLAHNYGEIDVVAG